MRANVVSAILPPCSLPVPGSALPEALSLHRTPFSAMAALLDDCVERAERAGALQNLCRALCA